MRKVFIETGTDTGSNIRGIGVHTRQLIKALKNQSKGSDIKITEDKSKADIVHFTYFKPFEETLVPFFKNKNQKWILTIHDLIPLIYPKHYPPGIKGSVRFLLNKFIVRKNIDAIVTISETSKKDICRFLKIDPDKVHVVYLASKEIFKKKKVTRKYKLPKKFVLYTGDINYNKNIPNLVKACNLAKMPFVIVGKQAGEIDQMNFNHPELAHLKDVDFSGVIRLGFVEDKELNDIFNLASVYVQASFYEGFGLPVLEAISCGTPFVVSKTQIHAEILGTDINFVNAKSPKDIARGILNPNMKVKLPRIYSWEKTADESLDIYEKV